MNKNKERVADFKNLCLSLGVKYRKVYVEKRTEGAITVKFYSMKSPTDLQCKAMMRKAELLGASKYGFKRSEGISIDQMYGWSFVMHFNPPSAPKQQALPFGEMRWSGTIH